MSPLTDALVVLWPFVPVVTPFLLGAGFLYLRTQFPTKADFDALAKTVNELATKLATNSAAVEHLVEEQDSEPTRIELLAKISQLGGRVSGVEGQLNGIQHQLSTTNDYLKILVDRAVER